MKKKKTWLYITLGVLFIAVSGFLYIQSHPRKPAANMGSIPSNTLKFKAVKEDLSSSVEVKGKSSYVKETIVYAPFSAKVTQWNVSDGAQVNKGDSLFKLEDKALRSEIELHTAQMRKQELETKLKTAEQAAAAKVAATIGANESEALQLYAQTTSKEVQAELDRLNRSMSASELETKQTLLAKAEQTAPDSGIFLLTGGVKPQLLKDGEPVGRIVDVSRLQMTTSVGEYDVFRIQPGMPVGVSIDALKQTKLTGKVEKVAKFPKASSSETTAAQFEIVISLDSDASLIAGLGLTATIQTDTKKGVLTVPTITVQRDKEGSFVMLETDQGIQKRAIKVGLETADKTEVLEGLQVDDTVVLQ